MASFRLRLFTLMKVAFCAGELRAIKRASGHLYGRQQSSAQDLRQYGFEKQIVLALLVVVPRISNCTDLVNMCPKWMS